MSASDDASSATFESLMQFLYRAPIGLVQTTRAGEVEMINPTAARLLMPLAPDGALDNLFHALRDVAPALSLRVEAAGPEDDVVCEGLRLTPAGKGQVTVLSLSLMRLGESRPHRCPDPAPQPGGFVGTTERGAGAAARTARTLCLAVSEL